MTRWGVGPRFVAWSALVSVPLLALRIWDPTWVRLDVVPGSARMTVGALLIASGLALWFPALVQLHTAFTGGRLVTDGAYGICRHPIYSAWAVLIVPGIGFVANTWLPLLLGTVMGGLVLTLVREEEAWLERAFGDAFLEYRKRVPAVLPLGWFLR